jgi:hypothetical protein
MLYNIDTYEYKHKAKGAKAVVDFEAAAAHAPFQNGSPEQDVGNDQKKHKGELHVEPPLLKVCAFVNKVGTAGEKG